MNRERIIKDLQRLVDQYSENGSYNTYCTLSNSLKLINELDEEIEYTKADTVHKIQDRLAMHFCTYTEKTEIKVVDVFKLMRQIAEEVLEEMTDERMV
jgi:hypothetical protein